MSIAVAVPLLDPREGVEMALNLFFHIYPHEEVFILFVAPPTTDLNVPMVEVLRQMRRVAIHSDPSSRHLLSAMKYFQTRMPSCTHLLFHFPGERYFRPMPLSRVTQWDIGTATQGVKIRGGFLNGTFLSRRVVDAMLPRFMQGTENDFLTILEDCGVPMPKRSCSVSHHPKLPLFHLLHPFVHCATPWGNPLANLCSMERLWMQCHRWMEKILHIPYDPLPPETRGLGWIMSTHPEGGFLRMREDACTWESLKLP